MGQYIPMDDNFRYDPHDTICLFYDVVNNYFIESSFGCIVYDIHRLIAPWQVTLFKWHRKDAVFPDVTNSFLVELVYPDEWYERKMRRI